MHGLFELYLSIRRKQAWAIENFINFIFTALGFVNFLFATKPLKGEDIHTHN